MLSLMVTLALLLATQPKPCAFEEVVKGGPPLEEIGGWVELAKHLDPNTRATTEAEAIKAVCYNRPSCNDKTLAFCDDRSRSTCYVRAPNHSWHSLESKVVSKNYGLDISAAVSRDQRYLLVGVMGEWFQRIGDTPCFFEGDDQPDCGFEMADYGAEYADYAIEIATMSIVWNAYYGQYDTHQRRAKECPRSGEIGIDDAHPRVGTTMFTRRRCDGSAERFTVADLATCNEAGRDAARHRAWADAATKLADAETKLAEALIAEGRALTRKRDLDGAIAAFSEALAGGETRPTALSGRGYARLLRATHDDLADARADFEEALAAGPADDAKFRAAVMFNLGLIAEKRKAPAEARRWFEQSHVIHPTAATKKRLARPP